VPADETPVTAQPQTDALSGIALSGNALSGNAFSGYAGDAPSGLQYAAPTAEHAFRGDREPAPQDAYPDPRLALPPDELPGYLRPYPPPEGFSGRGPRVAPVVLCTLLFGVFGSISAARRARRAEVVGDSPGKYWTAFGVTLTIGWVVGAIAAILFLATAGFFPAAESTATGSPPAITAAEVSQSMVEGGTYAGKGGKQVRIKAATCAATSVDAHGAGTYRCSVALTDSTKVTLSIRADASGWRILGKIK
jgi:hypothetical protein